MSIHLISGPMFAGKTAMLIDKFKRYKSQETVLLKHSCDTRYSNDYVVSRNGESFSATAVSELLCNGETMFGDRYKNLAVIGIDEGQFFPNIANCAHQWALQGKNVIITAIKTGIYMEPIQAIAELAAIADLETQLRTGCRHCAGLALFTYRKKPIDKLAAKNIKAFIGDGDEYIPLCRRCFHKRLNLEVSNGLGLFSNGEHEKSPRLLELLQMNYNLVGEKKLEQNYIRTLVIFLLNLVFFRFFLYSDTACDIQQPTKTTPVYEVESTLQNILSYIFIRASSTKGPFEPHKEMLPINDTIYGKNYLPGGQWLVGSVRDDCANRWVLVLENFVYQSQTCKPARWGACYTCPQPTFRTVDLSDSIECQPWKSGSAFFYDMLAEKIEKEEITEIAKNEMS